MLQQEKVEKLVQWFVRSALRHAEAMEALEQEAAAEEARCLNRFHRALQREGGVERFLLLLEHPDPRVAAMAAVYARDEAPERCRGVLKRVAGLPGLIGFRAGAALELWESGES